MGTIVEKLEELSREERDRIEASFKEITDSLEYKPNSKTRLKAQALFFNGAMVAVNKKCTYWQTCLFSGRDILETSEEINNRITKEEKVKAELRIQILTLERHRYAPELNKVHLIEGKTITVPSCTEISDAIDYIIKHNLWQPKV